MSGETTSHLYGGSDDANRETPTEQGFHGEAKAPLTDSSPDQSRKALLGDGVAVTVEETSGIAAAEAKGKTGLSDQRDRS